MTNYEWLKKHDYMPSFIALVIHNKFEELTKRYGLRPDYYEYIADWLEEERQTKKYVECKKVADIISLMPFRIPFDQKKFSKEEVQQLFRDYCIDLLSAIGKLITKEIDE